MSQSRAAKLKYQPNRHQPGVDLKLLDLLYAVLLHVLVFTIIAILAFWQTQYKSEPLKRIEVTMISAQDLAKLQRPIVHKTKPKSKPIKRKAVKIKVKKNPKVIKPTVKSKPIKKPTAKPIPAAKVEDDFDPFAPLVSSSNTTAAPKKASTARPDLADLVGKQLSSSEKERYIALMQAAVQHHWKVAASAAKFSDPLVEMKLLPTGHIAAVTILESSGNQAMDASLIRAIKAASPFELPAQQFEFFRVNRIRFHPLK
ncbi:MAG: TonB family protein [Mariprofundus sp.]|nr:TonB family protein [Mariprofundus sp.]